MYMLLFFFHFVMTAQAVVPPDVSQPIKGTKKNRTDAVVVIGNESYQQFPQVVYATKDSEVMGLFFQNTLKIHKSRILKLNNAKYKKLDKTILKASKKVNKGTLWIYYAGHGFVQKSGERAILSSEARNINPEKYSISFNDIFAIARKNKRVKRVVIIADANFGTKGRDGLKVYEPNQISITTPLPNSNVNEIVWLPSEDQTPSPMFPIAQHGLFTYLLAGSLRGWADGEIDGSRDGTLTFGEIQKYVRHKTVAFGIPTRPTVFAAPEVQDIIMHSMKQEAEPPAKVIQELSQHFFMRRIEDMTKYLQAEADNEWQVTMYEAQKGGRDGEDALRAFLEKYEYSTIVMKWAIYVPQVQKARQLLQTYEKSGNIGEFSIEDCQDIEKIKQLASKGTLSDGQMSCMESQIRLNRTQTKRTELSLILIRNQQAKKDMASWEKLMRRHLEEYDRSDPTLCLSFSAYLAKKGEKSYREAFKWANFANENRSHWKGGDDYIHKSNMLLRIRAELATNIWIMAETLYRQEQSPENDENVLITKGLAKECAREWMDYAKALERYDDARKAFDMCVSAGNVELCRD